VALNWNRNIKWESLFALGVYIFWEMVEAHMICVAGSRIPEMRLLAISNIKEIIVSGFHYFSKDVFSLEKKSSFEMSSEDPEPKNFSLNLKPVS
jgi:acetylglutamate synthase